jgi:hypothetical protein
MAAITFTLLSPVASSYLLHANASAAVPTGSLEHLRTLHACRHIVSAGLHSATIQVLLSKAEPTVAFRVAIWLAAAIIAALPFLVINQAQRLPRPARTGSKRWEAGWARHGRPVAAGGCAKASGG